MVKKLNLFMTFLLFFSMVACWVILSEHGTLNICITTLFFLFAGVSLYQYKKEIFSHFSLSFQKRLGTELITIILSFFILALVSYLAHQTHWQVDISPEKSNTLSEKTVKIIGEFQEKVTIDFYTRQSFWKNWRVFFHLFKAENSHFDYRYQNIEKDPSLLAAKGITEENTAIFSYRGREVKAVLSDELSVANALMKLLGLKSERFLFLTGHGELGIKESSRNGVSYFAEILKKEGHQVYELNLREGKLNLEDILVIPGIKDPLLKSEEEKIEQFLAQGGRFFFLNGVHPEGEGFRSLNRLLRPYGIQFENKMVIDRLASVKGGDASNTVVERFPEKSPVLSGFKSRVFFPIPSYLSLSKEENQALFLAASEPFPASWAESDFSSFLKGQKIQFNQKQDTKGPLNLALAVRRGMSRGVVISSHFMISNQYQNHAPQFNFVLNGLDWVLGQEKMASLNRPTLKLERVLLSQLQLDVIFYGAIIFGPLLLFSLAGYFFFRRKSL